MGADLGEVWAGPLESVDHPYQVAIIEALRHTGEPLSAIGVVDVLDGYMSMWSAAAHLMTLERLGIVEPGRGERAVHPGEERFNAVYRLVNLGVGANGP